MAVNFQHSEYQARVDDWKMVRTICAGDSAVKKTGQEYLPNPVTVSGETPTEIAAIYESYKQRAMLMNVAGRTKTSLVGAVFRKAPTVSVPATIAYVMEDVSGTGISIYQQSQMVTDDVLMTGRAGLLVDYPTTDQAASVSDVAAGTVRANIIQYTAEQIINWRTAMRGGKSTMSLVVLSETFSEADEYSEKTGQQLRALRLVDGLYVIEIHRKDVRGEWQIVDVMTPTMANGSRWTEIPFCFIGATNNDTTCDMAPLFDLAVVNRKHYQLSADWFNALFFAGQPQPWMAGLNIEWRDTLLENGIVVGSRAPIPLPEGGAFGYATVPADTAIQKELDNLMTQMVQLGARLSAQGEATKTATQSAGEQEIAYSVISLVASNVSEAYEKALQFMLGFVGGTGETEYELSSDIAILAWDAATLGAITMAVQTNTIPKSDAIKLMQRLGIIDAEKTVDEVQGEIDTQGTGSLPFEG